MKPLNNISAPCNKKNLPDKKSKSAKLFISKEALIVMDTSMGIMSFNDEAREILNSDLNHGQTFSVDHFTQGVNSGIISNAITQTLKSGVVTSNKPVQMKTVSGLGTSFLFSTYPLYSDRNNIKGSVLSFRRADAGETEHKKEKSVFLEKNSVLMEQESLLEALPEGVFTINTKWQVASFNRMAEKITGYTRKEVLGRYCWEVFRSDLCELGCPLRDALETGRAGTQQDVRILKKKGGSRTILVNTGVLRDDQGLIVGAIETFRTLTGEIKPVKNTEGDHAFSNIIGRSTVIKKLFETLPDIAASEANVFITGESGTGKELFARSIHNNSSRAKHPFVAVNCSALAETLLESELFGHEKSAFTGATKIKQGRFELVKKGTLFLDEIGELKPSLQIKLLRVLEQREFERVGGIIPIPLEARIISATNRDLFQALENGSFRKDFYYRLRTVPMVIPPLRHRKEDIPLLVDFFIRLFNTTFKKNVKKVDRAVMDLFLKYHWPGNVRELERAIEHAFVFVKGPLIGVDNLPQLEVFGQETLHSQQYENNTAITRDRIIKALGSTNGKKNKAALLLGISRTSLWRKMKSFNLS